MKNLLIATLIIMSLIGLGFYSNNNSLERELTRFHDEKIEVNKRNGEVKTPSGKISFSFIPASPWSICEPGYKHTIANSDRITVVINDEEYLFIRSMENINAVPNPSGRGKFMESWRLLGEQISREERRDIINVLAN